MIGVDGDRVTEFDLMYTVGVNETFEEEVTVPIVELVKEIKAKKEAVKKLNLTDEERRERHKKYMVKYNKEARIMELDPRHVDVIVTRYCDYMDNRKVIKNGKEVTWN